MPPDKEKELKHWEELNKRKASKLRSKPKLLAYETQLLSAFMFQSRRRQYGMSELPLTIDSIYSFGLKFGYKEDIKFFIRMIAELDDEYLKFQSDKREAEKDSSKKKK